MPVTLKKIKDDLIEFNFGALKKAVDALTAAWFSTAREIGPVALVTGDNSVRHNLGRAYKGYVVVKKNAAITVYDKVSSTDPDNVFTLNASGPGTVTLRVF